MNAEKIIIPRMFFPPFLKLGNGHHCNGKRAVCNTRAKSCT